MSLWNDVYRIKDKKYEFYTIFNVDTVERVCLARKYTNLYSDIQHEGGVLKYKVRPDILGRLGDEIFQFKIYKGKFCDDELNQLRVFDSDDIFEVCNVCEC